MCTRRIGTETPFYGLMPRRGTRNRCCQQTFASCCSRRGRKSDMAMAGIDQFRISGAIVLSYPLSPGASAKVQSWPETGTTVVTADRIVYDTASIDVAA